MKRKEYPLEVNEEQMCNSAFALEILSSLPFHFVLKDDQLVLPIERQENKLSL